MCVCVCVCFEEESSSFLFETREISVRSILYFCHWIDTTRLTDRLTETLFLPVLKNELCLYIDVWLLSLFFGVWICKQTASLHRYLLFLYLILFFSPGLRHIMIDWLFVIGVLLFSFLSSVVLLFSVDSSGEKETHTYTYEVPKQPKEIQSFKLMWSISLLFLNFFFNTDEQQRKDIGLLNHHPTEQIATSSGHSNKRMSAFVENLKENWRAWPLQISIVPRDWRLSCRALYSFHLRQVHRKQR